MGFRLSVFPAIAYLPLYLSPRAFLLSAFRLSRKVVSPWPSGFLAFCLTRKVVFQKAARGLAFSVIWQSAFREIPKCRWILSAPYPHCRRYFEVVLTIFGNKLQYVLLYIM